MDKGRKAGPAGRAGRRREAHDVALVTPAAGHGDAVTGRQRPRITRHPDTEERKLFLSRSSVAGQVRIALQQAQRGAVIGWAEWQARMPEDGQAEIILLDVPGDTWGPARTLEVRISERQQGEAAEPQPDLQPAALTLALLALRHLGGIPSDELEAVLEAASGEAAAEVTRGDVAEAVAELAGELASLARGTGQGVPELVRKAAAGG